MPKKTIVQVRPGRGAAWWTALSTEQKRALVYPRLKAGESNLAIAESLGVTPNSIASQRNKWNNAGKPDPYELHMLPDAPAVPKARAAAPKAPAARQRKPETPPMPELPKAPPEPPRVQESAMSTTTSPARPPGNAEHKKLKVAASHRTQCDHEFPDDKRQCAFEGTVKKGNKKYCENHAHLH